MVYMFQSVILMERLLLEVNVLLCGPMGRTLLSNIILPYTWYAGVYHTPGDNFLGFYYNYHRCGYTVGGAIHNLPRVIKRVIV